MCVYSQTNAPRIEAWPLSHSSWAVRTDTQFRLRGKRMPPYRGVCCGQAGFMGQKCSLWRQRLRRWASSREENAFFLHRQWCGGGGGDRSFFRGAGDSRYNREFLVACSTAVSIVLTRIQPMQIQLMRLVGVRPSPCRRGRRAP